MTIRLIPNTPVEEYTVKGQTVLVKREDRATPYPGPPFSKVRGLVPYLWDLKELGFTTIGYVETSVSMAGWGVAWACYHLGLECILWDPQYEKTPPLLRYHRKQWKKFNPKILPIKAGMAAVNYNIAAKEVRKTPDCFLLPLGLPLPYTVMETAKIARETWNSNVFRTVVTSVGSGTICAGLLKGLPGDVKIFGVMTRTGSSKHKAKTIHKKAHIPIGGFLGNKNLSVVDPGWRYADRSSWPCPFPCHPWYDRKAWQWLDQWMGMQQMDGPVMFWNIGRVR